MEDTYSVVITWLLRFVFFFCLHNLVHLVFYGEVRENIHYPSADVWGFGFQFEPQHSSPIRRRVGIGTVKFGQNIIYSYTWLWYIIFSRGLSNISAITCFKKKPIYSSWRNMNLFSHSRSSKLLALREKKILELSKDLNFHPRKNIEISSFMNCLLLFLFFFCLLHQSVTESTNFS